VIAFNCLELGAELDIRGFPVLLLRIADDFDAMISLWME
jgi:hypothetical protein